MFTFTLTNGTKLDIGLSLVKRAITITSCERQGDLFLPEQRLEIPLKDVKELVAKGKQVADMMK